MMNGEKDMVNINNLKNKITNRYMNLSIAHKILTLNFIVIILIALIIGIYSYLVYSNSIINKISNINLRDTRQITRNIDTIQKDIYELSTFIILDDNIQNLLAVEKSSKIKVNNINDNLKPLSTLLASKDAVSFISIYGNNGLKYYVSNDNSSGINDFNTIKNSSIYRKSLRLKGQSFWEPLKKNDQIFIKDNQNPKIAMFRNILNLDSYTDRGFMMVCINLSYINNLYQENLKIPESIFMIIDSENNIITYKSSNNTIKNKNRLIDSLFSHIDGRENNKTIMIENQKMLLTYSTTTKSKWKVIYLIPMDIVLKPVKSIMFTTLIVIILCLITGFILSMYTSSVVTTPIKKLLTAMQKVKEGNFKEKVNFVYKDEIGKLGAQYNNMIDNLHQLINRVFKLQLQEKEAELKALQAQINPHFLYNTLDTIFWKAEKADEKEISEMIYALSKLFRLSLNRGNDLTSVRKEIKIIEYYILLQKKRYKERLEYVFDIDNKILDYKIPKLILQPFVENSIIHGTEESQRKTLITISGFLRDNNLHFIIKDNGSGIDQETLVNIFDKGSKKNKNHGYAIYNVNERLELYYDENYQLDIESDLGKGTRVTIILPVKTDKIHTQ